MIPSRLPAESQEDYDAFISWLIAPEPRPAPHPQLSAAFRWEERASALGLVITNDPSTLLHLTARIECEKLARDALTRPGNTAALQPREVFALVEFLRNEPPPPERQFDLKKLTAAELAEYERLSNKARS